MITKQELSEELCSAMIPHLRMGSGNWEFIDPAMSIKNLTDIIADEIYSKLYNGEEGEEIYAKVQD